MIPAPALQRKCPHCGAVKKLYNIASGNTFGAKAWSDTKVYYPMMTQNSPVQRCLKCKRYFFLSDSKTSVVREILANVFDRNGFSNDTGALSFPEAREALEQLYGSSSDERRFLLRLLVLHTYNDKYGRAPRRYAGEDDTDRAYFIQNCRAMTEMAQTNGTLKAELFREIGDFEMCLRTLDSLGPAEGYENSVRGRIREKALQSDSKVFML